MFSPQFVSSVVCLFNCEQDYAKTTGWIPTTFGRLNIYKLVYM